MDTTPIYGSTNPSPQEQSKQGVQCFASVVELIPEKEKRYRELHAEAWPAVVDRMKECNCRNYSIFVGTIEKRRYLFGYFEYTGSELDADMKKISSCPTTARWWKETDPCQRKLLPGEDAPQWMPLEMVFHAG